MIYSKEKKTYENFIEMKQKEFLRSIYKSLLKKSLNDENTSNDTKIFNLLIAMKEISEINNNIKKEKNLVSPTNISDEIQDLKELIDEVQYLEPDGDAKKTHIRVLKDNLEELLKLKKELEELPNT